MAGPKSMFDESVFGDKFERGFSWNGYMGDDGQLYEITLADPRDMDMPTCPSEVGQEALVGDASMVVDRIDRERGVIWFRKAE
jgi:hypothetical protein